ncbi:MAG: ABC transporter substrate-binding protein [Verrucomicrobiia bacterium]|jgi:peptide/nickel transport system substrate-binding protein
MKRLLGLVLVGALALGGCQRPAKPEPVTLTFGRGADSQKLDPADVDDGESMKVLVNVCEGLVRFKHGTTEPEPCLATSWTISPDGLTYTFKLRTGVKFHDGTPLDAPAAAFSFLRQMDKSNPAHLPDATFAYWSAMFNMITAVEVVDPMTLRLRLREPNAPLLASLCIPAGDLISPKFIDQRHPVGTGPFRFVDWVPNERITLDANPDYWDGKPQIDRLIFKVVPDSSTRLIQLQTGQIQAMDGIDPNSLPIINADKNLTLLTAPGLNVCYLAFNCQKPPLDNASLRRIIASAINKKDIIEDVYRGAAIIAKNPLPPFVAGYNDAIPVQPPHAIDQILPVFNRPIRLEVMTNPRPYLPNPLRAAEMIKADLAKAGIPIEIVPNEWGAHLSRTSHGEHEMALLGWVGDNGDADNFLYVLLDKDTATLGSALNVCFWMNDAYHDLMIAARRELDTEKRAALYRKSQEIVFEEAPMVPLAHAQQLMACRATVSNILFEVNGDILFQNTTVK